MLFLIKTIIKYLLLPLGIIHAVLFRSRDEIIILMYHRVDDGVKKELAVTRDSFNWHMGYLYRKRYSVISMEKAYSMISNNGIVGRHIVISFDDGYRDFYKNAYPILHRYKYPSIMYLCPGYIESPKKFWWDLDETDAELMEWKEIYELDGDGLVEFGSHTVEHRDMNLVSPAELEREIVESKTMLEKGLQKPVRHFAYPRGIYSKAGEQLLRKHYDTAVLISNGERIVKKGIKQTHALKRIPVLRSDGRYLFIARIKGWLAMEELTRKYFLTRHHRREA
ncbi:MAG TPA: polysaccharide deacetylase family protein [Clostridia bacterium]|nr:polysaccharide deacetylase family protein [Clostridia bacterium]